MLHSPSLDCTPHRNRGHAPPSVHTYSLYSRATLPQGSCAPRSGTPVALKPRQCVITASADLFDLSQVRSMWMHNMYLESARDTETSWSRNTLLSTNGTTLYLTHTTFQGAGLDEYDGASFENGLLMDQSRLYAYGAALWQHRGARLSDVALVHGHAPSCHHEDAPTAECI